MEKTVCELFAGVGGFRLGLERQNEEWNTVWFSQWEPDKTKQWAHDCYVSHFGDSIDLNGEYHTNDDIATVDKASIPNHNLLVGGFPCQDYSVAHSLATSEGIEGKKGVLWWEIRDTIINKHPPFCLFENVDRLLKSPAKQRGRDFGVILACLNNEGYSVEWRVINAADYGAVQRRRRTFIFAYRNDTVFGRTQINLNADNVINNEGFFATTFPVDISQSLHITSNNDILPTDLVELSESFTYGFENAGLMRNGQIYNYKIKEQVENQSTIRGILEQDPGQEYYISESQMQKWIYLKGSKKIPRKTSDGHEYIFSEGPVAFPDQWDKPSRTMLTSEGTLNRSSHVVTDPATGRLRILSPVETERLQGFDDNWTKTEMPLRMRYFCMGNALVVPLITRMGETLSDIFEREP